MTNAPDGKMDPGLRRGDDWIGSGGLHLRTPRSCTTRYVLLAAALLLVGNAVARAQYPDKQSFEVIEHGRYMASAADCTACHTAPGGEPLAGGGALETPFGILLAPNITPDVATGIGGWTDDEFINAVQNGIGHGGIYLSGDALHLLHEDDARGRDRDPRPSR